MDATTELALRAIVRGLHTSGAISLEQLHAISTALKDEARDAMDRHEANSAHPLIALSKGIKADATALIEMP